MVALTMIISAGPVTGSAMPILSRELGALYRSVSLCDMVSHRRSDIKSADLCISYLPRRIVDLRGSAYHSAAQWVALRSGGA
jgi:hypothetical protein